LGYVNAIRVVEYGDMHYTIFDNIFDFYKIKFTNIEFYANIRVQILARPGQKYEMKVNPNLWWFPIRLKLVFVNNLLFKMPV